MYRAKERLELEFNKEEPPTAPSNRWLHYIYELVTYYAEYKQLFWIVTILETSWFTILETTDTLDTIDTLDQYRYPKAILLFIS